MHMSRTGLTLIELVMTISLAAILGIPVGLILSRQLQGAINARDAAVAMSLARDEMERLESLDSASGLDNANGFCHPDLNLTSPSPAPIPGYWAGYSYDLTRIVQCQVNNCASNCASPSNANNGVKRIEIRVTRTGSGDLMASLVTYRTKYVRYGP